jgi:hypothetical protein
MTFVTVLLVGTPDVCCCLNGNSNERLRLAKIFEIGEKSTNEGRSDKPAVILNI